MKNQGISLISLIITIIVIIILAAIVIFTGLGTPDSANFAHFCQDVDNVQSAVLNRFADLKAMHATANQTRTNEQIYYEIATGETSRADGQYLVMNSDEVCPAKTSLVSSDSKKCQNITANIGLTLPEVRQSNKAWYITKDGQVFNATGYPYKVDGTTYYYFTANAKTSQALNATQSTYGASATGKDRADLIADALIAHSTDVTMTEALK